MADTAVAITAGSGTNIDTRTESTNSNHRQVIVIGDPATNAGVAPVDATNGLVIHGGVADNGADSGNPVKVGGVYNSAAPTYTDGDRGDLQVDANGNLLVSLNTALAILSGGAEQDNVGVAPYRRGDSFQATITSADATTATSVKAKTAAKNIYLTDIIISVDTAMNVQLQDDAGTPAVLMEQIYMPANSVFAKSFNTPIQVATNQDLDVLASTAGNISVTVSGYVI